MLCLCPDVSCLLSLVPVCSWPFFQRPTESEMHAKFDTGQVIDMIIFEHCMSLPQTNLGLPLKYASSHCPSGLYKHCTI